MAYVYRHIRLDKNEPFYIGLSLKDDNNYSRAHSKKRRSALWMNVINKTEYKVDILMEGLSDEDAKIKEIEFITLYGRKDLGTGCLVNHTCGGDATSGEIIARSMRSAVCTRNTGKKHAQETKYKMSLLAIGERNSMFGRNFSKEHRSKMGDSRRGRTHTEETKEKLRLANLGEKNQMFGRLAANSKLVLNTETGIFYSSCFEAFKYSNLKCKVRQFYKLLSGSIVNTTSFIYV